MMKNLIKTALLLLALLLPATAAAFDFEVDGIYYNFLDDEVSVEVTKSRVRYSGDVTIPNAVTYSGATYSVTAIGDSAFFNCQALTSVTIPNSVTSIGKYAFWNCTSLTAIDIPNTVTTMGVEAFSYCQGLTSVTIPNSVTSIGVGAFMKCNELTSIIVESGNVAYDSRDNCNAIIETASNTLIAGCRNTVIPRSVTAIGDYAFGLIVDLGNVDIPSCVTYIGVGAFIGCSGLTGVNIPNAVTSIGNAAFYQCTDLTDVTIGDSVTTIGQRAFYGCSELVSVALGPSVTTIGNKAFMYCRLTSLTLPNSVTSIGDDAFKHCSHITDVYSYITDFSVLSTGHQVFSLGSAGDYSYRTLHVPNGMTGVYQADDNWYPFFGQIVEDLEPANLRGDVNGDGQVNLADVNAVVDVILGYDSNDAADVNDDGEIGIADINAIIDIILNNNPAPQNHDYVDLGLPSGTLWATCNVGADSPEQYGDYFAWGEAEPKDSYVWETYKWCDGSNNTLRKYCTSNEYGSVDNKTELDPDDDAAFMNWGPQWRMPTEEQIRELELWCSWQWTTMNGVNGCVVTGRNGNTIFLPAAGYRRANNSSIGSNGYYWSRVMNTTSTPDYAQGMDFTSSGHVGKFGGPRSQGCVVRPVLVSQDELYIEQQSLDLLAVPVAEPVTGNLTIVNNTNVPVTVRADVDAPFLFLREEGVVSSTTIEVPANSSALLTVMFKSDTPGEFNGNLTVKSSLLDGGQRVIPVHGMAFTDLQEDYVDLGLPSGTLWATRDIGADSPEELGDRFAWGETVPKEDFGWYNYKWCHGYGNSLTKYCTKSEYGTVDNLTELEPEDDAAYVNWGEDWHMPSLKQMQELKNNCTYIAAQRNGIIGRLVTGPNGNSIFMPAENHYWSRSLYGSPDYAYGMHLNSSDMSWNTFWAPRFSGERIRAVRVSPSDSAIVHIYIEQQSLDMGEVYVGQTGTADVAIVNQTTEAVTVRVSTDAPFSLQQEDGSSAAGIVVDVPASTVKTVTVLFTPTMIGQFGRNILFRCPALDGGRTVIPVSGQGISDSFPEREYVDLGLPSGTLWATCNIGAPSYVGYGDYFAWGETEPKDNYSPNTYKWYDYSSSSLTKYCPDSNYGTFDGKIQIELEDDAAYVNWGPSWRMPTFDEFNELCDNCTWKWKTVSRVNGYQVTGPNGNSIFLPAAGEFIGTSLKQAGDIGYYWLSTLSDSFDPRGAYFMYLNQFEWDTWISTSRYNGFSVRPVCVSPANNHDLYIEQDMLLLGEVPIGETRTGKLTIFNNTDEPQTLTATASGPFSFRQDSGAAASITVNVPKRACIQVTVMFTATTPGEFNGIITFTSSALADGQSSIPVQARAVTSIIPQEDYVDLGLPSGTLWATRNVGAGSPEQYGDHFAWGETEPKQVYDWSTYKWCQGTMQTLTKYCHDSSQGTVDNLNELEPEDDAATVNWGPQWRMPTQEQIRELINNCIGCWTTMNGVNGWLVIGPNGNTMFLPAAGVRSGDSLNRAGIYGEYWSSSLYYSSYNASELLIYGKKKNWQPNFFYRFRGHSVRPVRTTCD